MAQITKNTDEQFPEDILFEIVSRLPAKSVGRFTTVSKSWYAFIRSPAFIARHLNRSIARNVVGDSSLYLLCMSKPFDEHKTCTLLCDNMISFDEVYDVELPIDFQSITCRLVGSCNGLVCLTDNHCDFHGRIIYVWNPLLRKFKFIRTTCCCKRLYKKFTEVSVGFWYDGAKNDYKLIRIMYFEKVDFAGCDKEQYHVEVYSLNSGYWRKIDDAKLPGIIKCSHPAFVDGALIWRAGYSLESEIDTDFILSFDTRSELFQRMEFPDFQEYHSTQEVPYLVVYKGCLAFFVAPDCGAIGSDVWSIWVMKEFGVVESWVKEYSEETPQKAMWPLGFTQNNEILIDTTHGGIIAFNFETKQIRILQIYGYNIFWINYTESLVFLEKRSSLKGNRTCITDEKATG
ncbi:F-box protein CPR30 [Abeliophyllum distichum]|uniref:F-box protein CPR30 n=1 Tax=Abeliophyllum distichum TaxID=126358 RepID=A0ABD1NVM5_9LAMI